MASMLEMSKLVHICMIQGEVLTLGNKPAIYVLYLSKLDDKQKDFAFMPPYALSL